MHTEEEISDVHIKVYYQQIAIIIFATCAIFGGGPGGLIELAKGAHAAPMPHMGSPALEHEILTIRLYFQC